MSDTHDQSTQGDTTILHVDMDAFFAAVEQNDRPELRGNPILVGGDPNGRGVVSTASYEARPFGCKSAMPMAEAVRRCPHAIVIRPRMQRYAEVSRQVFEVFERFTPLVEPISVDEAFLDVQGSMRLLGSALTIAENLKRAIFDETRLTASVGVAPNKFLAKLASDHDKPDGLVVVDPANVEAFLDPLPISRLWGVGKATLPKMTQLGVATFSDLKQIPLEELHNRFGQAGDHYYKLVRGIDQRQVVTDREAKSISHEVTFAVDVDDDEYLRGVLLNLTENVAERLRRHYRLARTTFLKIRAFDFTTFTRNATLDEPTDRTDIIWESVSSMFKRWRRGNRAAIRLIGAGTMNFEQIGQQQMNLFEERRSQGQLDDAMDQIRRRFGKEAIARGASIAPRHVTPSRNPMDTE